MARAEFLVMSRRCGGCLMDPKRRIVSASRASEVLRECRRRDVSFICHLSPIDQEIACRGHFDTGVGQMSRICERLKLIREVDPEKLDLDATQETP